MLLVGDIGGTKTLLAVFSAENNFPHTQTQQALIKQHFTNSHYHDFSEILHEFLTRHPLPLLKSCTLAVAGPVADNNCHITNLPWQLKGMEIAATLKLPPSALTLLNDLAATAIAIPITPQQTLHSIQPGRQNKEANKVIIAPGTGLGEATLYWNGKNYQPIASEGGHCDFAPRDDTEIALLQFARTRFNNHVSVEQLISGPGIRLIYEFFCEQSPQTINLDTLRKINQGDANSLITRLALAGKDKQCEASLATFTSLLAAEAGNLVLKTLALGGVYIAGGIAPAIVNSLDSDLFRSSFVRKGRFSKLLEQVPVQICMNPETPLLGALEKARKNLP